MSVGRSVCEWAATRTASAVKDPSGHAASPPGRWPGRSLLSHRRGAAGVEMAFIMMPLMMFIIGIFELGFTFYIQQALDLALYTAVRQVATGAIQNSATSMATFMSVAFCPAASGLLPCANVAVTVTPSTGFTGSNSGVPMTNGSFDPSGYKYCPGQPGQLMMAQAVYPAPSFLLAFLSGGLTTYHGQKVRLISSTLGFVNEFYTATAAAPSGC
jgi:Flp pilus assembly protein TadG